VNFERLTELTLKSSSSLWFDKPFDKLKAVSAFIGSGPESIEGLTIA
jgi:hypothetical protein